MYPAVPITAPSTVSGDAWVSASSDPMEGESDVSSARSFAKPKSRIFTKPSGVTITFSGLRSRWTMPAPWAFARPSAICTAISSTRFAGSGRSCRTWRSVQPSTNSITMKERPDACPTSWIVTMLGWFNEDAARASREKRARRTGSAENRSGRNLIATSRWRSWSRARNTSPMPPAPRRSTMTYRPTAVPTDGGIGGVSLEVAG